MDPKALPDAQIDLAALTRQAGSVSGSWPLPQFTRLLGDALPWPETPAVVDWSLDGETRRAPNGTVLPALHLRARAALSMPCQRCLQPLQVAVDIDRHFLFAADEAQAQELDERSDDDVLAWRRRLDLHELLEDELILALPLVPRHEQCPDPLPMQTERDAPDAAVEQHPFAALAALRGPRPG